MAALVILLAVLVYATWDPQILWGAFMVPLLHIALSKTISKLTRHEPNFRAGVFWPVAFGLCGLIALLGGWVAPSVLLLGLALGALLACRWADHWKRQLLLSRFA